MKQRAIVLIVDDDELIRQACGDILAAENHAVILAASGDEGIAKIADGNLDLVITDLKMAGRDGMDVLRFARAQAPDVPVIMITGYPTIQSAIESVRTGAFDFVCKPVTPDELMLAVNRALETRRLVLENRYLREHPSVDARPPGIIASSIGMQAVFEQVGKVAPTETTVLITGESGVGKEVVARAIHSRSSRREGQFVVADCATLASTVVENELFGHIRGAFTGAVSAKTGLFEVADRGTLFLDEVANIPLETQSKLLRVLETGEYRAVGSSTVKRIDVRLVAATNVDLEKVVAAGRFREDLFYRLNVFPIHVPPLRERTADVRPFTEHFLRLYMGRQNKSGIELSDEALVALENYPWPGNVRELRNVIERLVIMSEQSPVGPDSLLPHLTAAAETSAPPRTADELKLAKKVIREEAVTALERGFVREALQRAGGNVSEAARATGMQRTYFQALMRKCGIRFETDEA